MKLQYVRESFDAFSGKAGELTRQFAFAGIAIIWIFKVDDKSSFKLPFELYAPLSIFCLGLISDLFHYVYAALAWGSVLRFCKKHNDDDDVSVSSWINFPTWIFFALKIALILTGYVFLLNFLVKQIGFHF